MNRFYNLLYSATGITQEMQSKLIISVVIILVMWLLKKITLHVVWKRTDNVKTRYSWQKTTTYAVVVLDIIFLGRTWFIGFQSIATFLGLLSAGIVIALKDIIANMAGWAFIILRRPFSIGDRIQIGDFSGDVIDIRVFQFTIMEIGNWVEADQSTGRLINIPNGIIFTANLANYTLGFEHIWNELPVLVTFESDWKKAKSILEKIINSYSIAINSDAERHIKEASKKFMIFYSKLTPIVYTSIKDSGVLLTIRYLTKARTRRSTEHEIWEQILTEFANHEDIEFAYPTVRYYNSSQSGN